VPVVHACQVTPSCVIRRFIVILACFEDLGSIERKPKTIRSPASHQPSISLDNQEQSSSVAKATSTLGVHELSLNPYSLLTVETEAKNGTSVKSCSRSPRRNAL
jgi:hypothetical protein